MVKKQKKISDFFSKTTKHVMDSTTALDQLKNNETISEGIDLAKSLIKKAKNKEKLDKKTKENLKKTSARIISTITSEIEEHSSILPAPVKVGTYVLSVGAGIAEELINKAESDENGENSNEAVNETEMAENKETETKQSSTQ